MMFVFAVVALRLLGLWLIATSAPSAIFVIFTAAGLLNLQTDPMTIAYRAAFSGTPLILGVLILFFSRLLAMLIVPKTHEPLPQAPSERVFTQLSLIVIGVFALVRAIPAIGGAALVEDKFAFIPPEPIIEAILGLLLIVGSGAMAGLVGRLRNVSPAERHRG